MCGDCQIRAPQCCGALEGETWRVARLVHLELPAGSGAVMSSHDAPLRVKAPGGRLDPVMGALYKSRGAHGFFVCVGKTECCQFCSRTFSNPIENVWARLRRDLSTREMEDLRVGKHLTAAQYRQRVAQLLNSYAVPVQGQQLSFLQKLVQSMPRRLAKCRANKYGPCGY